MMKLICFSLGCYFGDNQFASLANWPMFFLLYGEMTGILCYYSL